MDIGKVLTRAWQITWRWKVLWILGFVASLGSGWNPGSNASYSTDRTDWGPYGWRIEPEVGIALIVAIILVALVIAIAVWVLSIIARGGLIAGVQQVEDEGSTSLGRAWRVGVKRFWTLFGLSILAGLPTLILLIAGLIVFGLLIFGTISAIDTAAEIGGVVGGIATLLCGGLLCCGTFLIAIILDQIRVYGERAAILDGMGWIDAFKRGWQVIREHLGPTVLLWLVFLVIGLLVGSVIFGGLAVIVLPLVGIFRNVEPGLWLLAPLCIGGLLGILISALIGSVVTTFTSATWTLAYRQLTATATPSVLEAPGQAEPA